jgi:hypothetical protein
LTFSQLPITKSSENWSVKIGKSNSPNENENKPRAGVFDKYSMTIDKKGNKDIKDLRIEAVRDEPEKNTMSRLWEVEGKLLLGGGTPFHFDSFPISVKARKLEVIITWSYEGDSHFYQERFIFNQ